jgi:hypothetical protein
MEIRLIEPRDAEALRTLRIRAVKEYTSAFAASVEEETALSIDEVAKQLSEVPLLSSKSDKELQMPIHRLLHHSGMVFSSFPESTIP